MGMKRQTYVIDSEGKFELIYFNSPTLYSTYLNEIPFVMNIYEMQHTGARVMGAEQILMVQQLLIQQPASYMFRRERHAQPEQL